jgi:hypothetical protein
MTLAEAWLKAEGYAVLDVSATSSFDLSVTKSKKTLKIEVKGTTNDSADAILMTHREVDLHRVEKGSTGLILVSGIRLDRSGPATVANGGDVHAELGWDIDNWSAAPIAFRLTRRV